MGENRIRCLRSKLQVGKFDRQPTDGVSERLVVRIHQTDSVDMRTTSSVIAAVIDITTCKQIVNRFWQIFFHHLHLLVFDSIK